MQITTVGTWSLTIGWLVAIIVLLLAILGLVGVLQDTPPIVFGLVAALAIARLI